jgi:hypothetical protein
VGGKLLPAVAAQSDDGKSLTASALACRGSSGRETLNQQIDDQAAGSDDLRPADAEAVTQVQTLRLYLEEFPESRESLRPCRLSFDASQFFVCVLLDCREVDLHC